jgi:hypothetical protein
MMPRQNYQQLLFASPVYQKLTETMQTMILRARGEDRAKYERIFNTEAKGIAAAKVDLLKRNGIAVRDFSATVIKIHHNKMKADENAAAKQDEQAGNSLLRKLDKI